MRRQHGHRQWHLFSTTSDGVRFCQPAFEMFESIKRLAIGVEHNCSVNANAL
jgi:hypothetical protein